MLTTVHDKGNTYRFSSVGELRDELVTGLRRAEPLNAPVVLFHRDEETNEPQTDDTGASLSSSYFPFGFHSPMLTLPMCIALSLLAFGACVAHSVPGPAVVDDAVPTQDNPELPSEDDGPAVHGEVCRSWDGTIMRSCSAELQCCYPGGPAGMDSLCATLDECFEWELMQ